MDIVKKQTRRKIKELLEEIEAKDAKIQVITGKYRKLKREMDKIKEVGNKTT